ncbi:MAG: threonine/serine dehydratase [Desulfosarcina sp.]|nr:threonine/serine dehydratase [Desulfosarcina sp.]MBC2742544.1 threonine/serine dehydratase [Desulfosarcina sp.]MBC2765454.1 threonine/serine dehydratase [Desulfosarcina sp.]
MKSPNFEDVLEAHQRITRHLQPTPLFSYPALNRLIGTQVFIKHENYQPVGAFKVRGGINLVSQLTPKERSRGLIAASTGNHGQSVAYAGQLFGVKVQIVVPEGANPGKVEAIRGMGAEVISHGAKFDDAVKHCEALAHKHGYRYVHSGDEPLLIAGVATHTLETLLAQPKIEVVIVPLGLGSGAAGTCIAAHGINPAIRVIAVQAKASPAGYESWKNRKLVTAPNRTFAEGVATGSAAALPQAILWEHLHDFVLVQDDEIRRAMAWMIQRAHTLAEGAGAAPLAAAYHLREELRGKRVALICSGGNTSLEHLREAIVSEPY